MEDYTARLKCFTTSLPPAPLSADHPSLQAIDTYTRTHLFMVRQLRFMIDPLSQVLGDLLNAVKVYLGVADSVALPSPSSLQASRQLTLNVEQRQ